MHSCAILSAGLGQTPDIVASGHNGFVVDVDDAESLAESILLVRDDRAVATALTEAGRRTAEEFAYECFDPAWGRLLDGFVGARGS